MIKVPYYASPQELVKSPGFLQFYQWIGPGSIYLRPAKLGGSQVDPGLTPGLVKLGNSLV
jgi:hypothetical protein